MLFCSDDFNRIRSDPTQLSAAKAITRNPVTVISGRGGTGKTEVVTSTLNAIDKFFNDKVAWFLIAPIATFDHENKVDITWDEFSTLGI
jgi:ATP-dependent exoDNAse (exonuclease V) alpha subunit